MHRGEDTTGDNPDDGLQLDEWDFGPDDDAGPHQRVPWAQNWRSTEPDTLAVYRDGLPTHSVDKSNQVNCTIDHLSDHDYTLHRRGHTMRSQLVPCRSKRCLAEKKRVHGDSAGLPPPCPCRYKFKLCLSSSTCEVFQQGEHVMNIDDPPSPMERKLTKQMKDYIVECLGSGEKTTAARLHTLLCTLVDEREMTGPAPKPTQVSDFVKNWRRKHPKNSMAPLIALCNSQLYDQQNLETLSDTEMVILCDSQSVSEQGGAGVESHLGDGSKSYPLRVGMICLRLIRSYIDVQRRTDCTTILHINSTHSMVINGYVVFAFGYSDRAGNFFPIVYFCTSQKRAIDIEWCIRFVKRVCLEVGSVRFDSQFVMMDGDKAQFNACATELPHAIVLMCWFHVTQNVWKHAREKRVSAEDTRAVFADLYDMHYASEDDYPVVKERVLASSARGSALRQLTDHIRKMWVNSHRFSRWQAFRTPSGYAASNNPLEQYHRTVKLQCPPGEAIPSELIRNLNGARLAFLNSDSEFSTAATASERLMSMYRLMHSRGCLSVHRIPPVGSVAADLYRVKQSALRLTAAEKKLVANSIRSVNSRRMQTENMPTGGWIVDTRSKSCSCAYNRKHALCCHVVAACIRGGVACPGVSMQTRQFVRPNYEHDDSSVASSEVSDGLSSDDDFVGTVRSTSRNPPVNIEPVPHTVHGAHSPSPTPLTSSPAASIASTVSFASTHGAR